MQDQSVIEHEGVVTGRTLTGLLTVEITSSPACGSCEARQHCLASENITRVIEVADPGGCHRPGDHVTIVLTETLAWQAAIMAYIFPFMIIVATLIVMTVWRLSELIAGLGALAGLAAYYMLLMCFEKKLKRTFVCHLKEAA